jgi:hypothetical protein
MPALKGTAPPHVHVPTFEKLDAGLDSWMNRAPPRRSPAPNNPPIPLLPPFKFPASLWPTAPIYARSPVNTAHSGHPFDLHNGQTLPGVQHQAYFNWARIRNDPHDTTHDTPLPLTTATFVCPLCCWVLPPGSTQSSLTAHISKKPCLSACSF